MVNSEDILRSIRRHSDEHELFRTRVTYNGAISYSDISINQFSQRQFPYDDSHDSSGNWAILGFYFQGNSSIPFSRNLNLNLPFPSKNDYDNYFANNVLDANGVPKACIANYNPILLVDASWIETYIQARDMSDNPGIYISSPDMTDDSGIVHQAWINTTLQSLYYGVNDFSLSLFQSKFQSKRWYNMGFSENKTFADWSDLSLIPLLDPYGQPILDSLNEQEMRYLYTYDLNYSYDLSFTQSIVITIEPVNYKIENISGILASTYNEKAMENNFSSNYSFLNIDGSAVQNVVGISDDTYIIENFKIKNFLRNDVSYESFLDVSRMEIQFISNKLASQKLLVSLSNDTYQEYYIYGGNSNIEHHKPSTTINQEIICYFNNISGEDNKFVETIYVSDPNYLGVMQIGYEKSNSNLDFDMSLCKILDGFFNCSLYVWDKSSSISGNTLS